MSFPEADYQSKERVRWRERFRSEVEQIVP